MADHVYRGDSQVVEDVWTLTPTVVNSETYTVTINGKTVSYTADSSALNTEIVAGLIAAIEAADIAEFGEYTWSGTTTLIATGPSDGSARTIAGDGTNTADLAAVHTTTGQGPESFVAGNFDSAALPTDGDNLYVQGTDTGIKFLVDQNGTDLAWLEFTADYTGPVGLARYNTTGGYFEDRETDLKISAAVLRIGDGLGQGSPMMNIDLGVEDCIATIYKTGTPTDPDFAAVHLLGTDSANVLEMFGGTVDIAMRLGTTAEWPSITVFGGSLRCGTGVVLGAVTSAGDGVVETRSAITTATTRDNGRLVHHNGAITTLTVDGGPVEIRATTDYTIGTLVVAAGKTIDFSKCEAAVTVTNSTAYDGATINDPNNKVTWTNATSTPNGAHTVTFVSGTGRSVKVS